jgi:hypothetical protein
MTFCIYLDSYALDEIDTAPENAIFNSKIAEHNAFDVLQDQDRYKNEPQNMFDVTESDIALEENNDQNSVANPIEKSLQTNEILGAYHQIARLVAINKITARSKPMSIKVGSSAYFGNIEISVEKCWNNGDIYSPSSKILVNVTENKIDEDSKRIFYGWLISGNIPVSVLHDPSYELISVDCYDIIKGTI